VGPKVRVLRLILYEAKDPFVKGVWLVFAVGAVQVFLLAGAAHAAGGGFFDDFLALDGSRWTKGVHNLGRSYLNPANVDVVDGNARFKIPARTLQRGGVAIQRTLPPRDLLPADEAATRAELHNRLLPLPPTGLQEGDRHRDL
jgi:hypothetical protein